MKPRKEQILLIAFETLLHLGFLASVFHIYFTSPLSIGLAPLENKNHAPASRLVLFVADGLRTDYLYDVRIKNISTVKTAFLRTQAKNGSLGISHTRVPTESRPGHVALIAGFYEDPSAIFRGWQENPVDFDSVFNQSRYTWAWGSPDILNIFIKDGASGSHVFVSSYASGQTFLGGNSTEYLDNWVLERVTLFFRTGESDSVLRQQLMKDKIIFFFHLLGTDTAGHTFKPPSREYVSVIENVDRIVKNLTNLLNTFYDDDKTAFVFTSDHGMTDWGSHGDGSEAETETPIIAWGAGIRHNPEFTDMEQADIAPLMSTLLGISIPVNSIGRLNTKYLNLTAEEKSKALHLNMKQILQQYHFKQSAIKEPLSARFYKPFAKLTADKEENILVFIHGLMKNRSYAESETEMHEVIDLALEGIKYYNTYFQTAFLFAVSAACLTNVIYLALIIIDGDAGFDDCTIKTTPNTGRVEKFLYNKRVIFLTHLVFCEIIVGTVLFIWSFGLPYAFILYGTVPLFMWYFILTRHRWIDKACIVYNTKIYPKKISCLLKTVTYLIAIYALVFSYFYREVLFPFLLAIAVWPIFDDSIKASSGLKSLWALCCVGMGIFPMLPVAGKSLNYKLMLIEFVICFVTYMAVNRRALVSRIQFNVVLHYFYMFYFLGTAVIVQLIGLYGLTWYFQITTWTLFAGSFVFPLLSPVSAFSRMFSIVVMLMTQMYLLSVSYEPAYLLSFTTILILWILLEKHGHPFHKMFLLADVSFRPDHVQDIGLPVPNREKNFRQAMFYLFFINLAFFGIGNVASINSFDPNCARNFVTSFHPFLIVVLVLYKTIIPFLLVSCFVQLLNVMFDNFRSVVLSIMIYCGVIGWHFFLSVKNEGSWKDIGMSISHFVIAETMCVFLLLLNVFSHYLTRSRCDYFTHKFATSHPAKLD